MSLVKGTSNVAAVDKNKQWQRELLMEKLRSRTNQQKTFQELSKATRMSMLEKRYALDAVEKSNLQKCLDSMQHCIQITTRQGLIERLEGLSRQLGLKFMEDTSGLFISSDMFYLEIILDSNGTLSDVKVHHECKIEQQSCSELVTCLLKGDFTDFTAQLEGLSAIYQLNAEPKIKSKAFVALQAMETDLYNLFMMENYRNDAHILLYESIVGIVQKRRGGHPMKLTYFVSPYDLLNLEEKTISPLTVELLSVKNIGLYATINLEASLANKLQILPIVTFSKDAQGISFPTYSPLNSLNSTLLPATFVLRLNKPIPICDNFISLISIGAENSNIEISSNNYIMDLIVESATGGKVINHKKGLFVNLPDQNHCYFFSENNLMKGSLVTSIPFNEPSQVSKILITLRKHALFYTLLASCARAQGKINDLDTTTMVEVSIVSVHQISLALEHPYEESMVTIEFDLKDLTNLVCNIFSLHNNYDGISVRLSKILQKSLSIPIVVRSLLKFWEQEQLKGFNQNIENGNFSLPLGPSDPGGRSTEFNDIKNKTERTLNGHFVNGRSYFNPSAVIMSSSDSFTEGDVNMFEPSTDNSIIHQFVTKPNSDTCFNGNNVNKNEKDQDFCKSPKSLSNLLNSSDKGDSGSLGAIIELSDEGVTKTSNTTETKLTNEQYFNNDNDDKKSMNLDNSVTVPDQNSLEKITTNTVSEPIISITPVTTSNTEINSVFSSMGLERRPGIEILPVSGSTTHNVPTLITITPIDSSKVDGKQLLHKKSDEKNKNDKKRKRKKDGSAMGPPEKMVTKYDTSNRSLNVSSKFPDTSPVSPGLGRKYSSSPASKLSPSYSSSSGKPSPKHSPLQNSPKHLNSGTSSPKTISYCTSSPKQSSSSGTGKPSMSTLKSATNSPKSEKNNIKVFQRDKDKERSGKVSSGSNSPKIKSSTVKLKQIDLSVALMSQGDQSPCDEFSTKGFSPNENNKLGLNANNSNNTLQNRARKSSLSAVIDKLKSAQSTQDEIPPIGQFSGIDCNIPSGNVNREKIGVNNNPSKIFSTIINPNFKLSPSSSSSGSSSSSSNATNSQSSEYMIKPSLDGMKITINKTRTKEASVVQNKIVNPFQKASISGSNSPKRHTGLKPGVNSGPASKRSHGLQSIKRISSPTNLSSQNKINVNKNNLLANKSGSNTPFDLHKKERSNKIRGTVVEKHLGQRPDPTDVMKILRFASPNNAMEGFMKSLNTNFQIPKLSARNTTDDGKKDSTRATSLSAPTTPVSNSTYSPPISGSLNTTANSEGNVKLCSDSIPKDISKYTLNLGKVPLDTIQTNVTIQNSYGKVSNAYNMSTVNYIQDSQQFQKNLQRDVPTRINVTTVSSPTAPIHVASPQYPSTVGNIGQNSNTSSPIKEGSPAPSSPIFTNESDDSTMRPPSTPCVDKTGEIDLTTKSEIPINAQNTRKISTNLQSTKITFPTSPSVSVHIVKSPVPSPLVVMPSPHSNSPCITDDELMDEALVGIEGK